MGIVGAPSGLTAEWHLLEPAFAGLAPSIGARLEEDFARGDYLGLHALLIIRHGSLVLERYFTGEDERWGEPLGLVGHNADCRHDIRSMTKSIVSLLYGIARRDGLVPPASARLLEQFPQYPDLAGDTAKRRLTVAHALSMRMGLAWNEDFTYADPANGEREMEAAPDRYRNILERPLVHRPGATFTYCGGATALLGHLIAKGTGKRLEDYAREKLFEPLGIADTEWIPGSDGEASASSGLRLRPRDVAKLGQLILNRGMWLGRQRVPEGWLVQSFRPRADVERGLRYGYQWWLGRLVSSGKPWYGAFGNGGQRLLVIPSLDMAVVIMAGNYNAGDQWKMPLKAMSKLIIPALAKA